MKGEMSAREERGNVLGVGQTSEDAEYRCRAISDARAISIRLA
jgi:hypothetical protein